jgi:hypothetical protein
MKKIMLILSFTSIVFLAGCGAAATISNVSVPDSAKDVTDRTIGTHTALSYISNSSIDEACATQVKLMTAAKWTESNAMENKGTYLKATYTDGKADMVVLCSETEISATEKATKVTLTLTQN